MAKFKEVKAPKASGVKKIPLEGGEKPEAHFYPNAPDTVLLSDKYDIEFTLSYVDTMEKIKTGEEVHTPQMVFCTPELTKTHDVYVHYLDLEHDTQKIGLIEFNRRGEVVVKEWV